MNDIARATSLTAAEAAKVLGRHKNTINNMVRRGELTQIIVGGGPRGKRITRESVDAYLKAHEDTQAWIDSRTSRDHGAA